MSIQILIGSTMSDVTNFYKDYLHEAPTSPYIISEIKRHIPKGSQKILDIGCGTGKVSSLFREEGAHVIGLDVSEKQITEAKKNLDEALICDVTKGIPYVDNTFDVLYSSMVLEHIFDFHSVLREMHRGIKPGGKIIIEVPNINYWPNRLLMLFGRNLIWMGVGKHIRAFNVYHLKRALTKAYFVESKVYGSILPLPKTGLKLHLPYLNRFFPGLSYSLLGIGTKA